MVSFFRQSGLVLLLIFSLVPPAAGRQYRIATVAWIGWSPLHVASEKGFWENQGLDVKVVTYDDPIVILEAIKAGRIDFAMDMAGSLAGIFMNGEPVVALAETNWSHGGDKIIVRKGDSLLHHKNEAIGVFLKQPSCLFFLDSYLKTIDLALADFRIVEINARDLSAQFVAGRLPAMVNYEPWANQAVKKGNGKVLATSADFTGCIPECFWGYKQAVYNMPDQDIHGILLGWIDAVNWLHTPGNRKAYYRILKETTFKAQPRLTHEAFARMLDNVRIHNPHELYERNRNGGGLHHYFTALKRFLEENDLLTRDFSPGAIFDNRYIRHVLKHNDLTGDQG